MGIDYNRNTEIRYELYSYFSLVSFLFYAHERDKKCFGLFGTCLARGGKAFVDLQQLEHLYITIYKPMFPEHPYTSSIALMLQSLDRIKVGGNYIDFTAPDLQGNPVRLSEQIDGKVALIDLWASWCGPCRRAAKSMIPVYEKYKSKGFTVVGIAREKAMQTAVAAAAQDGYPWKILVEIGDAGNIWSMYGVGNSGGGTFLVDRDGKILAISPTTEEVEDILKKMLE